MKTLNKWAVIKIKKEIDTWCRICCGEIFFCSIKMMNSLYAIKIDIYNDVSTEQWKQNVTLDCYGIFVSLGESEIPALALWCVASTCKNDKTLDHPWIVQ